ncbi:hypothetical protein [Streptomyces sp. NPDC051561]|uniref:hypothetical protein n=1 Tax=Streptomyces sp. NPDC051561 TaxID=3365658 RepID=UPI00379D588E
MPIDPFLALNAMVRAEVTRSAEPGSEPVVRPKSPRADAPATERRTAAPDTERNLERDRAADDGGRQG